MKLRHFILLMGLTSSIDIWCMSNQKLLLSKKYVRALYSFSRKSYLSHEWVFPGWAKNALPNGVPLKIDQLVDALRNPYHYKNLGASIPRGVLLYGPPGTGKTLMMRTVAYSLRMPFEYASATQFVSQYYGANKLVKEFFQKALGHVSEYPMCMKKKEASDHVMIFIDEIELIGMRRNDSFAKGTREQLTEFLVQLDGFEKREDIVIVGATHRPEDIDEALLRRIPEHVYIPLPTKEGRKFILSYYIQKIVFNGSRESIEKIAEATQNYSGDDLHKLVNRAACLAAYKAMKYVTEDIFWEILGEKKIDSKNLYKYII